MLRKISGIKRSVLIIAIIPVATVTLLLTVLFNLTLSRNLEQSLLDRGYSIIRQLGPASEYGVFSANAEILKPLVDAVMAEVDVNSVVIFNSAGKVLIQGGPAITHLAAAVPALDTPVALETADGEALTFHGAIVQTEYPTEDIFSNIEPDSSPQTSARVLGQVSVELSLQSTRNAQMLTAMGSAIIALTVMLLSGLLALRIGRTLTLPIFQLTHAVEQLENGKLDIRVDSSSHDELGILADGINTMADSLQASYSNLEEKVTQATAELRATLTELEQRNRELDAASREAESASQAKSVFMANTSHEIRTPLNGIQGFLMLLSKTPMNQEQLEYLDKIQTSTRNLSGLLNDILDFSRLEMSHLNMSETEFALRQLLEENICISLPEARQKETELVLIVEANLPDNLYGAAERIAQVVKNLVSNAVKFTSRGEVIVHATKVPLDTNIEGLQIAVSDTGIGIDEQDQKRLFLPFSQLETGRNRSYAGTGLGLAISKSLVEMMGGQITVQSQAGLGSCFTFTIPLRENSGPVQPAGYAALQQRKALLVSSHKHILESLRQTLLFWGLQVETSDCASHAITQLLATPSQAPDFVLLDSEIEGRATASIRAALGAENTSGKSYLILLEQTLHDLHVADFQKLGFDAVLHAPPCCQDVALILQQLLQSQQDAQTGDSAAPQTGEDTTLPPFRVLLADDNAINRQFLTIWLQQAGVEVTQASDGEQAIQACHEQAFDLILMDLHMPRVDGLEAVKQIRMQCINHAKTPVVAITADATEKVQDELASSSISEFLIKPVAESELIKMLNNFRPHSETTESEENLTDSFEQSVDSELGLRLASGNRQLWHWSLRTLYERLPVQQDEIAHALAQGDMAVVADVAHHIVGSAGYCGATQLNASACRLEQAAHQLQSHALPSLFSSLRQAIVLYQYWVEKWVPEIQLDKKEA